MIAVILLAAAAADPLFKPDAGTVQLIMLVIPLVVGLITKKYASKPVKTLVNAASVALISAIAVAANIGLTLRDFFVLTVTGFLVSSAAHEFIWKKLGVSEIVANIAPATGIGAPVQEPPPGDGPIDFDEGWVHGGGDR